MTKKEIRSEYLKLRLSLSGEKYSRLNQVLCNNFFANIDLTKVKTLHTFLPIPSKKEPDTRLIIEKIKKDSPEIRISIPKIDNDTMVNFYFEREEQLQTNAWGISEPQYGVKTLAQQIDMVLVPLLAFDAQGNRVGYGKGFYDQFLMTCRPDCQKIGLSFFEATTCLVPIDPHDVRIDWIITPSGAQKFAVSV